MTDVRIRAYCTEGSPIASVCRTRATNGIRCTFTGTDSNCLRYHGRNVAGLVKDTLLIPPWEETEVLLIPEDTGPALFHCHNQMHMEAGLQALFTVL